MKGRPAPAPALHDSTISHAPGDDFVVRGGETYARIRAYDRLPPFFMTLASDADLWLYVSSRGGLTAGRGDADGALFPYETVDRLHDAHHHTGPVTLIRLEDDAEAPVWSPFAADDTPAAERNLEKHVLGCRLVREEIRHDLGLAFRDGWAACDEFGWVRTAELTNRGPRPVRLSLLDGLRNIMPHGVPLAMQQSASNLVDAYKTAEIDADTGLGLFSLTAGITDRAEAVEVLRANAVWCAGLPGRRTHLAPDAPDDFRRGRVLAQDAVRNGGRGCYLVSDTVVLEPGESRRWHLVGDVGLDHARATALRRLLREEADPAARVDAALDRAEDGLRRLLASADGLQRTARPSAWAHHAANVLFNVMRGGVFWRNDDVPKADLLDFLRTRNLPAADRAAAALAALPAVTTWEDLHAACRAAADPDLERLAYEYLPLHFGRRHGDPSRPWNRFSIRGRGPDGEPVLSYEGNWRDIFQNWEALAASFPGFLTGMVAKFVNASTADGFNPYRITRDGVDWEVAEPDDPWANIGYWGDHQIVYLTRLLEALHRHQPHALTDLLDREIFSYADVPYRIRPYAEILQDASDTIVYDEARAAAAAARTRAIGTDGKLRADADGSVHHANLLEKLLVPVLAKLSNLVPDAGVWMNTQRPEWNDANNALAAGGASVVTLAYLRRHLALLDRLLEPRDAHALTVASPVAGWFTRVESVLGRESTRLRAGGLDAVERRAVMDALGGAFSDYRDVLEHDGLHGRELLKVARVRALFRDAVACLDHCLAANRRDDGLYHSYNVTHVTQDGVEVERLPVMLEGQVAAIASGALAPDEVLSILEELFRGPLHRADQDSFQLYPERTLPGFLGRNSVPEDGADAIGLVRDLLAAGDASLLLRDADGALRFQADVRQAADATARLDALAADPRWSAAAARDRDAVLELFEETFRHRSYTGRSGVMFGYEGLGCIYWHMVAKLLLAVQETVLDPATADAPPRVREGLAAMYYRVRAGLGYEKPASTYGAFPTDPYSHTPPGGGAKQPGMTGQVKEEVLTRLGELGVRVDRGVLAFRPTLLEADEFLRAPATLRTCDVDGADLTLDLPAGTLAFTVCQVPVMYELADGPVQLRVALRDGAELAVAGDALDHDLSDAVFRRTGRVRGIHVTVPRSRLRNP